MPATYDEAYSEAAARFEQIWNAQAGGVTGSVPTIRYWGAESGQIPTGHFCRFSMQPVDENQSTFRNREFETRYTSEGLIFIQLFAPRKDDQGAEHLRLLAQIAKSAFRGTSLGCGIWFRRVRANILEPEHNYFRTNVIANYIYDDIA